VNSKPLPALPRSRCRVTGLRDRRQWLALANLDGSPSVLRQGAPGYPCPAGGRWRPWEPARPRGFTGERAHQAYSAPLPAHNNRRPRSHNTGLPLLPAFIILHISAMTGLKGLLMGNVLRISIFPLRTMEALSCCVLKVQTKAARAVFSSAV